MTSSGIVGVVGAGILFQAITFGSSVYSFTFFVVPWTHEFGVGRADIMIASTVMSVGGGLLGPLAGKLLDRFPVRVVVLCGLIIYGAGLLSAGLASKYWHIIAAYGLLVGPGMTFAGPLAAQVLATRTVAPEKRGLALGWVVTGTSVGGILIPPIVALLIEAFGWRAALIIVGPVAPAVLIPLVWKLAREASSPADARCGPTRGAAFSEAPAEWSTRRILARSEFWAPLLAFIPAMAAFVAVQYNLDPLGNEIGLSSTQTSLLMSLIAASMIGSKILFGYLSDRITPGYLCGVTVLGTVVALLILAADPTAATVTLACVVLGVASGSFLPLLAAILANCFGSGAFGRAMGLALPFLTAAGFGGLFSGWIYESFQAYAPVFYILAAGTLAGGALAVMQVTWSRYAARFRSEPEPSA